MLLYDQGDRRAALHIETRFRYHLCIHEMILVSTGPYLDDSNDGAKPLASRIKSQQHAILCRHKKSSPALG